VWADAVRTALLLARQSDFTGAALHDAIEDEARRSWKGREFLRDVGRRIADGDERHARLAALFGLDPALILRLHADHLGMLDRRRVQKALDSA
jgi:lycopene beta-cyclase